MSTPAADSGVPNNGKGSAQGSVGDGVTSGSSPRSALPAAGAGTGARAQRGTPIRIWPRGRVSIEERREDVREFLARRLVWVLVLTLVLGAGLMATRAQTGVSAEDTRMFFQVAFTGIISLVSAATGFYFGSSAGRDDGHRGDGPDPPLST